MVAIMEGDMSATGLEVFHHLDPRQIEKVRQALPESIRALWPTGTGEEGGRFEPAA